MQANSYLRVLNGLSTIDNELQHQRGGEATIWLHGLEREALLKLDSGVVADTAEQLRRLIDEIQRRLGNDGTEEVK